jgi:hypothetical protein
MLKNYILLSIYLNCLHIYAPFNAKIGLYLIHVVYYYHNNHRPLYYVTLLLLLLLLLSDTFTT